MTTGRKRPCIFRIQDTNKQDEQVNYGYDSAARVNSVVYSFGGSSQNLFGPSGTSPIYDAFGRLKNAKYGATTFNQSFATTGRRLLTDRKVTGTSFSRDISYPTTGGVKPYDPVGRERTRKETIVLGDAILQNLTFSNQYEALGRLSNQGVSGTTLSASVGWRSDFAYDALGNVLQESNNASGTVNASLGYAAPDFDRICGLTYRTASTPQGACNVSYDGAGNTVSMPTAASSTRTLSYFPNGAVSGMADGVSNASFGYDAFSTLQQLTVNAPRPIDGLTRISALSSSSASKARNPSSTADSDPRRSYRHTAWPNDGQMVVCFWRWAWHALRNGPGGLLQAGHRLPAVWRGGAGSFFPMPVSVGPGTTFYENEQFNGGDLLAAFGVVNLGARVYDPVIGRFLSRDPLLIPRTAATTNPYAFSHNDPINKLDPSGMDPDNTQNVLNNNTNGHFGVWVLRGRLLRQFRILRRGPRSRWRC